MVGPSKILTVSYGTFSCTLEGFDEPFVMMKAVAEYFRDLAAEDRYFGAVPPVPDEAMLQQIAEREIHRRVEAKVSEYSVSLKQAEPEEAPAITAPTVAEPVAVAAAAAAVEPEPEPEAAAEPPVAETFAAVEAAPEPVAEVQTAEAPMVAEAEAEAGTDILWDMDEPADPAPPLAAAMDEATEEATEEAMVEEAPLAYEEPSAYEEPAAHEEPVAEAAQPAPDSIAAKLMRIRAVVEGVRAAQGTGTDMSEEPDILPEMTETLPGDFGFALDTSDDSPELVAAEAARAAARATVTEEYDEDQAEPLMAAPSDELAASFLDEDEDEPVAAAAEAPAADEEEDRILLSRIAELGLSSRQETVAEEPEVKAEAPADPAPAKVTNRYFEEDEALAPEEPAATAEESPNFFQRARARVIRIGKVATRLGRHDDQPEANAEEPAEVEAAPVPEEEDLHSEGRATLEAADAEGEGDVNRLMEEARQKLDGPENRRRFSAISHLKAAVAATLADRKMHEVENESDEPDTGETEIELYREDLSKVVRPRRPTSEQPTTQRPRVHSAPLILVSEQRVDREDDLQRKLSSQPSRIAGAQVAMDEDDEADDGAEISPESAGSFARFADQLGAHSLTELLEAAAVYTASVEGQPYFTRPNLLKKVEFVSSRSEFSREDGLRSFGTLLREGKIMKISRGQFAVAEASKYMIETRRAAN